MNFLLLPMLILQGASAPSQSVAELERTRDQWQHPQEIFDELGIRKGSVVADVGAGSGYFTFRLSRRVGGKGRVWALDISPIAVAWLEKATRELNITNITPVHNSPTDPMIDRDVLDAALIVDTFHEFDYPSEMLAGVKNALKADGLLCIIDTPQTPAKPKKHAISKDAVIQQAVAAGFVLKKEAVFLLPIQFMLVFQKASGGSDGSARSPWRSEALNNKVSSE